MSTFWVALDVAVGYFILGFWVGKLHSAYRQWKKRER